MPHGFLIDSCVVLDALLPFREGHADAVAFFQFVADTGIVCYIPSTAYFEYAVAVLIHFKRKPEQLPDKAFVTPAFQRCKVEVISLHRQYVNELFNDLRKKPLPDLKSQDMIYFCIARNRGFTLITQDRKLRNTTRKGGMTAYHPSEAIAVLRNEVG